MGHNYRILQHPDELDSPVFAIHATYYDDEGHVQGWADEPVVVGSSVEELLGILEQLRDAAFRPVIDLRDERWAKERPTGKHEKV